MGSGSEEYLNLTLGLVVESLVTAICGLSVPQTVSHSVHNQGSQDVSSVQSLLFCKLVPF